MDGPVRDANLGAMAASTRQGDPSVLEQLRELPIGAEVSDDHLQHLARIARLERFETDEVVQREGMATETLRIVAAGRISLTMCVPGTHDVAVGTLSRGELLGWSALIAGGPAEAQAQAVKPSRCIALERTELTELCAQDPELGYHLVRHALKAVVHQLHDVQMQLLAVFGTPASAALT